MLKRSPSKSCNSFSISAIYSSSPVIKHLFTGKSIYSEKELEYANVDYTPNLKRPIAIIDPETTEEVKPVLYFDEKTNEVKGKCKLKPYKSYFAFEVREEDDKYTVVGGNPVVW